MTKQDRHAKNEAHLAAYMDGQGIPASQRDELPFGESRLTIIVATDRNGVIGKDGKIPWHVPADLKHFKEVTMGHSVIMGRKTWESIPEKYRPLVGRDNIVLSRDDLYFPEKAMVVDNLQEAIVLAGSSPFVIGGGQVYAEALPLADRIILSVIDAEVQGDTFFEFDRANWRMDSEKQHEGFTVEVWKRINKQEND